MSRGGKLAPEVNRYVLDGDAKKRSCANLPQSFVRQESKVRRFSSRYGMECNRMIGIGHMLMDYSYNVTPEELFDLFGKFGPIRYVPRPRVRDGRRNTDS
jgi:RNA recognition motif-containing protein